MARIRCTMVAALATAAFLIGVSSASAATFTFHATAHPVPSGNGPDAFIQNVSGFPQIVTVRCRKLSGEVTHTVTTPPIAPTAVQIEGCPGTGNTGEYLVLEVEAQTDRLSLTQSVYDTDISSEVREGPGDWIVIGPNGSDNGAASAAAHAAGGASAKVDGLAATLASISNTLKKVSKIVGKILKKV